MTIDRRTFLLPLVAIQAYLALVLILYIFGPWPWPSYNDGKLVTYLVVSQLLMAAGYLSAWPRVRQAVARIDESSRDRVLDGGLKFFQIAFWITFVMLVPTSLSRTGSAIPDVLTGFAYTGAVYNANNERLGAGNAFVVVEYARIAFSIWTIGFTPMLLVVWRRIPVWQRVASIFFLAYSVAIYVAIGVNKGVADLLITIPFLVVLAGKAGESGIRIPKWVFQFGGLVAFVAFLIFFARGQIGREGDVGSAGVYNSGLELIWADSGIFEQLLGRELAIAYESLTRYLTSGYYALALSFDTPNQWTFGVGNSMFMASQIDSVFDTNYFTANSIPGQLETHFGISQFGLWHSIYPWLASDFGFFGAILVLALMSRLLASMWSMSILTLDYRCVVLTYLLLILFFYVPANNQVFQSGESFVAFVVLAVWLIVYPTTRRASVQFP